MDEETPEDGQAKRGLRGLWRIRPQSAQAHLIYFGLFALQHRGQESAGISVSDGETVTVVKDPRPRGPGLRRAFAVGPPGHLGIGHTRYSTTGSNLWENSQPFRQVGSVGVALGHNGNLTNTARLAALAPDRPGTTDSELMLDAIAAAVEDERSDGRGLESALVATLPKFEGAFSLVVMDQGRIIGIRDPHGFRPLCLGRLPGDGWVLASETAALDLVGATPMCEVEPGEMVVIDATGIRSVRPFGVCEPRLCLFEFVYFARPDSLLYGQSVQAARQRMGRMLAEEAPAEADVVVPVPESGIPAAQGFAAHSGIPYTDGLVKNRTSAGPSSSLPSCSVTGVSSSSSTPSRHPRREAGRPGRRLHRTRQHHSPTRRHDP